MAVLPEVVRTVVHGLVHRQDMSPVSDWPQSRDIHIIGLVPSTLTFASSLPGIYWFCTMQRNFRLSLILILVLADACKSFWIMTFSIVALTQNGISSRSALCQAGGFFLQMSLGACDLVILFLTLHVTLQVLSPQWIPGSKDGLYSLRRWVVLACAVLPAIGALVPFSRYPENPGYSFDGAYCSLFLGPLWFTLALSWVPRYTCWILVLFCMLAVYIYTASQAFDRRNSLASISPGRAKARTLTVLSYVFCTGPKRRTSVDTPSFDLEPALRGQRRASEFSSFSVQRQNSKPSITKLLLYPAVYCLAWSIPFSAQIMSFSKSSNINSVYPLRAGSVFCISILGLFDVVIFCWREKPWRYNVRGDGSWKGSFNLTFGARRSSVATGCTEDGGVITEPSRPHRMHNKGTDSSRRQALDAYQRLAMERADATTRPPWRRTPNDLNLELTLTMETIGLPTELDLEKFLQDPDRPVSPGELMHGVAAAKEMPPPELASYNV